MTALVLDASVCLKWFLHERGDEPDTPAALQLHARVRSSDDNLLQPAVWRAEVAAGLARMMSEHALTLVENLNRIDATIIDTVSSMALATQIAVDLHHHLFDTIYHAVAIEHGIDLVTADEHYYRKARKLGHLVLLRDWHAPRGVMEEPASYRARARKSPARARRKR